MEQSESTNGSGTRAPPQTGAPIVVDMRVPPTAFELGDVGDATVTFERQAGTTDLLPSAWVRTDDQTAFCQRLAVRPGVDRLRTIYVEDETTVLYRFEYAPESDRFHACLRESSVSVLRAGGSDGEWRFRLRFCGQEPLESFQTRCLDRGVQPTVDRLATDSPGLDPLNGLTDIQIETLSKALEDGYFEVPRRASLVDIAEDLDISDQAVSARLRRGTKRVLDQSLDHPIVSGE